MLKLYCKRCNYRFEKEKTVPKCPYCAADNTVQEQLTTQDILNELAAEKILG